MEGNRQGATPPVRVGNEQEHATLCDFAPILYCSLKVMPVQDLNSPTMHHLLSLYSSYSYL